jgi:hypothetical protein
MVLERLIDEAKIRAIRDGDPQQRLLCQKLQEVFQELRSQGLQDLSFEFVRGLILGSELTSVDTLAPVETVFTIIPGCEWNVSTRMLSYDGRSRELTPLEARIFNKLLENAGKPVKYKALLELANRSGKNPAAFADLFSRLSVKFIHLGLNEIITFENISKTGYQLTIHDPQ